MIDLSSIQKVGGAKNFVRTVHAQTGTPSSVFLDPPLQTRQRIVTLKGNGFSVKQIHSRSDECSVQLERHSRRCYRRKGKPKSPKPKHPYKVHIWGGISCRGATKLVIFNGILVSTRLLKIYENSLLPFVKSAFPDGHRFMQDNDHKHCHNLAKKFLKDHNINWWKTPPESPDMNPIENVWGH